MVREQLVEAVNKHDLSRIKAIIVSQVGADRDRPSFWMLDSVAYAEPKLKAEGVDLFVEDNDEHTVDGTLYREDKTLWDREMWENLRIEFEYNFSRVKFERIVAIMQHLRETGDPYFQVSERELAKSQSKKSEESPSGSKSHEKTNAGTSNNKKSEFSEYAIGAGAGAAAIGVLGNAAGFSLVGGVLLGAVAGAGIIYLKNKKD